MNNLDATATIPCNLCGGTQVSVVGTRSRSGAAMRSVCCKACGLVWVDPRPHQARQFYTEDYRLAYKNAFEPRARHVLRAGHVALDRLNKVRPLLAGRMRILDVGSGGGEFAYLLKGMGHEVVGIEPNRGYGTFAATQYGLDVRAGFVGDFELPKGGFDLITIWHVLEHTEDPGAVLLQLRGALRPGGRLVVEVPNIEATCQSPGSTFHEAHIFTFGQPTLAALGRKQGLESLDARLSEDGGNLTMTFANEADARVPGYHEHVTATIAAHTPWRHALTAHPWRRAIGRLGRRVGESLQLRHGLNGKALLDRLYAQAHAGSVTRTPAVQPGWKWLAGAYLLAVAAEEVLVDRVLPAASLSSTEVMGIYAAIQVAVVLGLLALVGTRPKSARDLLKFGGWAAPLFVVPAVC